MYSVHYITVCSILYYPILNHVLTIYNVCSIILYVLNDCRVYFVQLLSRFASMADYQRRKREEEEGRGKDEDESQKFFAGGSEHR